MACCGKGGVAAATLRWTVDLNTALAGGKTFSDGTKKKTFMTVQDANAAVTGLGLSGIVRPRPANAND